MSTEVLRTTDALAARVSELEADLARVRHLLRELWDSAALTGGAPDSLIARVFDELNRE